jgi:broad specificity phosphatase PhoE
MDGMCDDEAQPRDSQGMQLYFVRHGESEANVLREISNRGLKHGLTEKGRQQATDLADKLRSISISRLYSSPLLRAIQTAEIVSNAIGLPYEITDALREYDCGIMEGRSDHAAWKAHHELTYAWVDNHEWDQRIDEGESFNDIKARFVPFVERLVNEYRDDSGGIVLIGHGGLYRCMMPIAVTNVDFKFTVENIVSNAGYVLVEPAADGLRCVEWCGIKMQ